MQGRLTIMDRSGDTGRDWKDPEGHAAAKEVFDAMRAKGHLAFKMKGMGTGEQTTELDPDGETLLTPQLRGG